MAVSLSDSKLRAHMAPAELSFCSSPPTGLLRPRTQSLSPSPPLTPFLHSSPHPYPISLPPYPLWGGHGEMLGGQLRHCLANTPQSHSYHRSSKEAWAPGRHRQQGGRLSETAYPFINSSPKRVPQIKEILQNKNILTISPPSSPHHTSQFTPSLPPEARWIHHPQG